ncbi:MAG: right-handed parallel beta-helix repeat-containing protein [Elusimicrobia bacterium]|nr:right-handed parallel beta-helix repeat-containing protein [Elusimicrobiota bacterium]
MTEDVWVQILALLAIVAGVLSGHFFYGRSLRPVHDPGWTVAADPMPAAPSQPPAGVVPASAPAPTPPQAPASRPRTAGHWIVDAKMPADADCATLAQAVMESREGDSITLRPGTYKEGVVINKSLTIAGAGVSPDQVTLSHSGARTVGVSAGRVTLENLSLGNSGGSYVVEVAKAQATFKNVRLRAATQGVRVVDADLDVADSELDAKVALSVEGMSRVSLLHATLTGEQAAVSVSGGRADVSVEGSRIQDSRGVGLEAGRFARVRMKEVSLTGNFGAAVSVRSGADVTISRSKITDNRDCGVRVDGAFVTLEAVQVSRNRCGVGFVGLGTLNARNSEFSELELGAVAIKPGLEKTVIIKGSGNIGLEIPKSRGDEKRPGQ